MSSKASDREKRRAAALRANLKRRKEATAKDAVKSGLPSDSEPGQSSQKAPSDGLNKAQKPP